MYYGVFQIKPDAMYVFFGALHLTMFQFIIIHETLSFVNEQF